MYLRKNSSKHLLILILLTVVCFSCNYSKAKPSSEASLASYFNNEEIESLNRITRFMNSYICDSEASNGTQISDCLQEHIERSKESMESNKGMDFIPSDSIHKLLDSLPTSLVNEWWYHPPPHHKSSHPKSIYLRTNSRYTRFLYNYGKIEPKAKGYHDRLVAIGVIGPSAIADILVNYKEYPLQDTRMQILLLIHFLTLETNI